MTPDARGRLTPKELKEKLERIVIQNLSDRGRSREIDAADQELEDALKKSAGSIIGKVGRKRDTFRTESRLRRWLRGLFWTATGLGWSLFMLGATEGHIRETALHGNFAPYNFLMIFSDGFVAVWLLVLVGLHIHSDRKE